MKEEKVAVEKNIDTNNGNFKRGQIYIASLGRDAVGSEQAGKRPVLIIQNDIGNKYSPTMIVAMLSTKMPRKSQRTHVHLKKDECIGLDKDCVVMTEQIRTISKDRIEIKSAIATVSSEDMKAVEKAMLISLGMAM